MTKRVLSVFLTFVILLSLLIPMLTVDAMVLTSWEWNSTGNAEGWTFNENITSGTVEHGYYCLDIIGGDANITSPPVSFNSQDCTKMELTYRNSTEDTNAELFWTSSDGGWGAERCMGFSTIADSEWHTITVDLSQNSYYSGTITQIRLDPTQNGSGLFEIDRLRFIPKGESVDIWNFSVAGYMENWESNSNMDSYKVADSSLIMTVSGQEDPYFINSSSSIDTSVFKKLSLTYRNDTDCTTSQFFWSGLGEKWSEERSKTFETVNDGDWHTVMVDLSNEATWLGTVKSIRFDPAKFASGTFEIDRIALGSSNASLETGATNVVSQFGWNWTTEGERDGWVDYHDIASAIVSDGSMTFNVSNATDPFVYSPQISLDTSVYSQMEIVYRSTVNNNEARLYWKTENNDFNQENSCGFTLDNTGNWSCCVLDLSAYSNWLDIVSQLRLDFAENGTGMFEVDRIRFVSRVPASDESCTVKGGNTTSWNWVTDDDYLGWTLGSDIANWDVAHGNLVTYIAGGTDPNMTSPAINIDTSKYKILEIKYKNEIANDSGSIYWEVDNGGWSEANSYPYTSIDDGKWHTLRIDFSNVSGWKGNITRLRIDPTTGGVGHYFIDRVAFMDSPSRYTMSNGYIFLSGVNGSIDTMHFDPNGTANYGENLLMGELYMGFKYNDVAYSSSNSDVNWTMKDNTLTINNIKFGDTNVRGKWVLSLNGNKLDNTFVVTSKLPSSAIFNDLGYCYDMVWDNDGFEVEASPEGALRVPFSKMISSDDRYHSAYAFKRMPSVEDESTIGVTGSYVDLEGANSYNFNLRFSYDTARISPICFVDHLKLQFRQQNASVTVDSGASLTRTLSIEVSQNKDITPEHFVSFEGTDQEVATALNEMLYEFGNSREPSCTNPDWAEWISTIRAWQDDRYLPLEKEHISSYYQDASGYVYTWGTNPGWPFPAGYDTNHYITTCANLINSIYNYYVYDGDEELLNQNLSRLRLAMDFLLKQYDTNYNLFRIDHEHHNGAARSVGSNYWDIVPYGNLSAYDNIYAYLALTKMAEIERLQDNNDRAQELEKYASDLKKAYNEIFWASDHYIQAIDSSDQRHDYGSVYLNLEAITYGLADEERAKTILDFLSNTKTSSGEADVFSEFVFSPRATMFNNPSLDEGGWYCCVWLGGDAYGSEQIQNGGTIFYISYYELMSRIKAYGADNSYERLKEIIDRYSIEHLQGGTLFTGEVNQHFTPGLVGCWGEFPENGLVPVAAKNGFMGIKADVEGLHITPDMPSKGLTSLTVNRMNYWGMHLDVTTTSDSVRIKAVKNDSKFTDWVVNGEKVEGLFDITVDISKGETVSLYRASNKYDLGDVDRDGKVTVNDATKIQRALALLTELDEEQSLLADVDNDGCVSISDATNIQMYIAKIIDSLS